MRRRWGALVYALISMVTPDLKVSVNLTADEDKIAQYTAWLEDPYWAPYLGRKNCIPSLPFLMDKLPYETGGDSSNENTTDQ